MAGDAMVFAMANPTPEVTPEEAAPYARVIATGRSDYPNQINNVLCFPGIFRGALDVRAREITEEMKMAAARGIASIVADDELREDYIIPSAFNRDVAVAVADAVSRQAKARGHRRGGRREIGYAPRRHQRVPRGPELSERRRERDHDVRLRMRVTMTGATGRVGGRLVGALKARGDEVTVLSRNPDKPAALGVDASPGTRRTSRRRPRRWPAATPSSTSPARTSPSAGPTSVKRRIRDSRELGTRNLVAGLRAADPRPRR